MTSFRTGQEARFSPGESVEILLVEDNPYDAELTMRALQEYHLANHLVWVKDGVEAVEFAFAAAGGWSSPSPSRRLVLLDLKLPRMNGHEVLKRLKSDPRTRTIPVVVLTSSSQEPDLELAWELGANSFIEKPVGFDRFVDVVKQLGLYWLLLNRAPGSAGPASTPDHD